jgi:hypothetical protein
MLFVIGRVALLNDGQLWVPERVEVEEGNSDGAIIVRLLDGFLEIGHVVSVIAHR